MREPSTSSDATLGTPELKTLSYAARLVRGDRDVVAMFVQLPGLGADARESLERICALASRHCGLDAEIWFFPDRTRVHFSR